MKKKIRFKDVIEGNIAIMKEVKGIDDAINSSATILLKNKLIKENYLTEIHNVINKYGYYMVFKDSYTAMPHAKSEESVNETSISLLKLVNPVIFEDSEIYFIFTLAVKEPKTHIPIIGLITQLMEDEQSLNLLKNTNDIGHIMKLLNRYSIEVDQPIIPKNSFIKNIKEKLASRKEMAAIPKLRPIKIITICSNGLGSSLMLAMNIEAICNDANILAEVEAKDLTSAQQASADFFVSVKELISQLQESDEHMLIVPSYHDKEAITAIVLERIGAKFNLINNL